MTVFDYLTLRKLYEFMKCLYSLTLSDTTT